MPEVVGEPNTNNVSPTASAGVGPAHGPREIGRAGDVRTGPVLVCVAGQHGNEPSGVVATARVLAAIEREQPHMRGALIGLRGNVTALELGVRYRAADLNRLWTPERIARSRERNSTAHEAGYEFEEMHELRVALEAIFGSTTHEIAVLDMHTTSSDSAPFVVIEDRLPNRAHAMRIPVPVVIGLEEVLIGTLPDYVNDRGHVSLGFEAGQHDAPQSADLHESAIWLMLCSMGILERSDVPGGFTMHSARLSDASAALPRVVELRHRHPVKDGDGFCMHLGFTNFSRIDKDETLANDKHGNIRSPERGRVFMPLYQPLGDDGFFLVRRVGLFWLWLSAILRKLGADKLAPLLPGVRKDADHPGVLIADRAVARWFTVEIFHLLGYRRRAEAGELVIFSRRHDDLDRAHTASASARDRT